MISEFAACTAFTQAEEGGYVSDPRDSGNWTGGQTGVGILIGSNMGVGAPALERWFGTSTKLTAALMRALPLATYEAIAFQEYWQPMDCPILPCGLDLMVFDFGWNRGCLTSVNIFLRSLSLDPSCLDRADGAALDAALCAVPLPTWLRGISLADIMALQALLGLHVDGIAGPLTLAALQGRPDLRDRLAILVLASAQVLSYRQLSNFATFGAGWLARSSRRRISALALLATQQPLTNDPAQPGSKHPRQSPGHSRLSDGAPS
nr:glycosyl hydrolase 108 family protein [uncultured Lichenicoccus sp.]